MSLLTSILGGPQLGATHQPWSDFWFQKDPRFGAMTQAGVSTSPEQAMRLGAVYACVRILADKMWPPLHVYRRRADGGKDRATDHPLYELLRVGPNQYQTAYRWLQLGMRHILLRGAFYCLIGSSTRRITELLPLDPDRMTVKLLDNGRRGYLYRSPGRTPTPLTQDDVFHVMGLSLDGITGCWVIEYASESVGRSRPRNSTRPASGRRAARPAGRSSRTPSSRRKRARRIGRRGRRHKAAGGTRTRPRCSKAG